MSDFDKWFKTEMLPAECDDERVVVGLRLCWDAAMLHAAVVFRDSLVNSRHMVEAAAMHECIDRLRQEVQGE